MVMHVGEICDAENGGYRRHRGLEKDDLLWLPSNRKLPEDEEEGGIGEDDRQQRSLNLRKSSSK